MYSSRCSWDSPSAASCGARKTTTSGWTRNTSGKIAIVTITDR